MKDKEKQREEMFNYLRECSNNAWAKGFDYAEIDNEKLREFLALLPEDRVVLSREEFEKLKQFEYKVRSGVCFTQKEWFDFINEDSKKRTSLQIKAKEEGSKEMAEKILIITAFIQKTIQIL